MGKRFRNLISQLTENLIMKCENCGTAFFGKFCPKCGTPVQKESESSNPIHQSPSTKESIENTQGKALLGFRSNKKWKKVISVCYLVFCGLFLLFCLTETRKGQVTVYDFILGKICWIILFFIFISPYIFLSNTELRSVLPLFKKAKKSKRAIGLTIVVVGSFVAFGVVNDLHSAPYKADMENHAFVVASSVGATCTRAGEIEYYCEYCGLTEIQEGKTLGHDMQEVSRIDACTSNGSILLACSRCTEKETLHTDPLGHDMKEIDRVEPTCTTKGSSIRKCNRCNATVSEPIEPLGHDMKEDSRLESAGDHNGTITYTCSRCSYQEIETTD